MIKQYRKKIQEIRAELDDVEWYSGPTVELGWRKYHEIIRDLCQIIEEQANNSAEAVSNEQGGSI